MSKTRRILCISLLGLSASVWLGATSMAPVAAVAPAAEVAQATAATPPAEGAGSGSGSGVGSGSGFGYGEGGGENIWMESGGSYLGVDTQDVTKERMASLKLKEERGVEVLMVDQDAPAGKAGLKEHDVILEFNGARVESVEQLRRMIHEIPPGRNVTLGISRDGQPLTLNATLADRSKSYSFAYSGPKMKMPKEKIVIPRMPEIPEMQIVVAGSTNSGLLVENLTPQLGEFFGAKDGAGVLVRSVEKGSPAEAAGFKAGDIIIRVEQDKVADRGDWRSAMRNHRTGKVSIGIIRDKREQTLSLALPEAKEQSSIWRSNGQMELDLDLDDLSNELEDMDIELDHLTPQMERLRTGPEQMPGTERMKEMLRLRKELSGQLTASLKQEHGELHQALAQAREQQLAAVHKAQAEATCAARKARLEAQRAVEQQLHQELEKARLMMLHRVEMD